jgi:hypothetical protein
MAMDFGGLPVKAGLWILVGCRLKPVVSAVINCGKLCENGRFSHYDKTFHFLYTEPQL